MFDGKAFGQEIVAAVKGYVEKETASLREQLAAMEVRIEQLERGGVKYVGGYQRAMPYARGDVVTHSNGAWVALQDVPAGIRPGNDAGAEYWQLFQRGAGE